MKIFTIVCLDNTKVKLDGIIGRLYTGTAAPAKMYQQVMLRGGCISQLYRANIDRECQDCKTYDSAISMKSVFRVYCNDSNCVKMKLKGFLQREG